MFKLITLLFPQLFAKQKISYHAFTAFSSLTVGLMQIPILHYHVKVGFIQNMLNGAVINCTLRVYYILLTFIGFYLAKPFQDFWKSMG